MQTRSFILGPRRHRRADVAAAALFAATCLLSAAGQAGPVAKAQSSQPALRGAKPPVAVCYVIDASSSNWAASDGYRASDPGPTYTRVEFTRLSAELLGADTDRPVFVAASVFGGQVVARAPLTDIRPDANRAALVSAVEAVMKPAGWTRVDLGVEACAELLAAAPGGAERRILVASDGRPEAPEASTQAQVTALRGLAEKLRAAGIRLDTVLYGDAATNKTDQAQKIMADLAEQGGGQLYLAPAGIDLLRVAVSFASAVTGIPEGSGRSVAVRGSVTVPVPVEKDLEALIVVVIRSTPSVKVDVRTPSRELAVGPGGAPASALTVVRPFTNPVAGEYTIEANGEGDIYATTLKRTKPLVDPVASPVPAAPVAVATAAAARPVPQQQPEAKAGGGGFPLWVLLLIPALLAASGGAAAVAWRRAVPERREDLVLWQDGVYIATERVGALRALAATNGELPLSMVFRDSAAALADYRLRRDGDGLTVVSSITEDDVRMLWPDQPVDLPSQPPVRLVLYREGMTPEALERDRPVAQVAMPRRESGRGPQTAAVAMSSSFAAETKQAPDAAVDPLEALAARAAQLRNGRV